MYLMFSIRLPYLLFMVVNPPLPGVVCINKLLNFSDTNKVKQTEPMSIPSVIPNVPHIEEYPTFFL